MLVYFLSLKYSTMYSLVTDLGRSKGMPRARSQKTCKMGYKVYVCVSVCEKGRHKVYVGVREREEGMYKACV